MKIVTRNPNKMKKNIAINSDYKELEIFEKFLSSTDFDLSQVIKCANGSSSKCYGINARFQGSLIYGALFRIIGNSTKDIRSSREKINKVKSIIGVKMTEQKIINKLKKTIDKGYMNLYHLTRCGIYEQTIEMKLRYSRSFEITATIPLIPARNAVHSSDGFKSFAEALNESERHKNFFMLGVTDMYIDTNESVGDIRLGLITYFQTGKNDRDKGIQYAWMCINKGKVCVVGLANDPVHAEKRMIRSAASIMREKIKEEESK